MDPLFAKDPWASAAAKLPKSPGHGAKGPVRPAPCPAGPSYLSTVSSMFFGLGQAGASRQTVVMQAVVAVAVAAVVVAVGGGDVVHLGTATVGKSTSSYTLGWWWGDWGASREERGTC